MAEQLISFVDDGFTHGTNVYYRGQHLTVDLDEFPHFNLSPDEQVKKYGRPFYQKGPWHGALYDTGDPALTPDEKKRLEDANQEIIKARESATKNAANEDNEEQDTTRRRRSGKDG